MKSILNIIIYTCKNNDRRFEYGVKNTVHLYIYFVYFVLFHFWSFDFRDLMKIITRQACKIYGEVFLYHK